MKKSKTIQKPKRMASGWLWKEPLIFLGRFVVGTAAYTIIYPLIHTSVTGVFFTVSINASKHGANTRQVLISSALIVLGYILFALPQAPRKYSSSAFWGGIYGLIVYSPHVLHGLGAMSNWYLNGDVGNFTAGTLSCALLAILQTYLTRTI